MPRISLDNVIVDIPVYDGADRSIKRRMLGSLGIGGLIRRDGRNRVSVRALNGVSLDLRDGDRLGLIGRNGAGKSTLLRVMAGIFEPTVGSVEVSGRVSTLLSVGMAMDPEMSGYENIDHIGALIGWPMSRLRELYADIEAFTELGEYLSMPVRTYSAGMTVRLSFALLAAQAPEVLLLDEVIGVGDAQFAERAARRIDALCRRSGILVVASHSPEQIGQLCNQVAWLEQGRIRRIGPTAEVMAAYAASLDEPGA
jgi:ABC-2 type transport system ATP-binding protein/lipopolysaccharide transport system ATP-binding protein